MNALWQMPCASPDFESRCLCKPPPIILARWASRRDSFCGKMSVCNNLTQYGIPYSLTTLHTVSPDSASFRQDLDWFAASCRVVKGLRNLRIGSIGARPAAFNTVRYSEKLLENHGISVETLDLSEVLGRINRMKDTDDAAQSKLSQIKS